MTAAVRDAVIMLVIGMACLFGSVYLMADINIVRGTVLYWVQAGLATLVLFLAIALTLGGLETLELAGLSRERKRALIRMRRSNLTQGEAEEG